MRDAPGSSGPQWHDELGGAPADRDRAQGGALAPRARDGRSTGGTLGALPLDGGFRRRGLGDEWAADWQIAARLPSLAEARLFGITSKLTPVLALTVTAFDTAGHPIQVSHLVLPGDRHELEDTYSLIRPTGLPYVAVLPGT